jgi:hypothetical protein
LEVYPEGEKGKGELFKKKRDSPNLSTLGGSSKLDASPPL